jgi:hypothetical protein
MSDKTNETNGAIQRAIAAINAAKIPTPHDANEESDGVALRKVDEIDRDEHRWYTISTLVYECDGGYIGVRGVTALKSEQMSFSDCEDVAEAFEMVAVPSVTYKAKG